MECGKKKLRNVEKGTKKVKVMRKRDWIWGIGGRSSER